MKKRQTSKFLRIQKKYKKLRERAQNDLMVLENYFGKGILDDVTTYSEIKKHLEAHQQEISYFGLRGIVVGFITAIFVYLFNREIILNMIQVEVEQSISPLITNFIITIITVLIFLFIYFIATWDFTLSDWKIRKQIYVNEYMLKLVEDKINGLTNKEE